MVARMEGVCDSSSKIDFNIWSESVLGMAHSHRYFLFCCWAEITGKLFLLNCVGLEMDKKVVSAKSDSGLQAVLVLHWHPTRKQKV